MVGLLTNNEKKNQQAKFSALNEKAMAHFATLFEKRSGSKSRHAAIHWEKAKQVNLPVFRHEDWRYTPLQSLLMTQYNFAKKNINETTCKSLALSIDAYRIVLVNGWYNTILSSIDTGPFQVTLLENQDILPYEIKSEIFLHITESLATQPIIIYLPKNTIAKKPLYLLNISSGNNSKEMNISQYRYHMTLDTNSTAQVIEHFVSLNDQAHFTGSRLTVKVGNNSKYQHVKLHHENSQAQYFSHNDILIGRDSKVLSNSFLLGAKLTRNQTSIKMEGENSTLLLNSLLSPKNTEIIDVRTYLEHNIRNCESHQLHKIIGMDSSISVFNGMIKVSKNALKTNSQMTNNTLLLGNKSEINTKPQLEIYTDDVKCKHGATVGHINDEEIFYLRSRGIKYKTAKYMIIIAFTAELTEVISPKELKQAVMINIHERLTEV
ncbi:FeS cluster assembly protein SufD [Candidatus Hartigia pinicola]|nr:FeS cluster assembly protein SufD [Candidatus Hartigia pinicola]